MRKILPASALILCTLFSLACQNSSQPNVNSNNQNLTTAGNQSTATSSPMPGAPTSPQPMNQPPTTVPQTGPPTVEAATAALRTELSMQTIDLNSARMNGDKAQLKTMLADDYKGTKSDGTVVNKAQEIAAAKKSDEMLSAMESKKVEINGETATVLSELSYSKKDNPGVKVSVWYVTDTLKKRNGKWVVVSSVERKP